MKTFYSILYVPFRPALDEKMSIALFLRQGDKVFFAYSQDKLQIIKQLMPDTAFSLLKTYLRNINQHIESLTTKKDGSELNLPDDKAGRFIEESYFSYLSDYSNNLIGYSKPKTIDIEANEEIFQKLFEKYVFAWETIHPTKRTTSIQEKVRTSLFPKIQTHVNLERHLTATDIPNLFAPTKVDFIGKNDAPVAGHTFDFVKRHYNLENDIARFVGLATAMRLNDLKGGKYYVIGKEPSKKKYPEQHQTWQQIRQSDFLEFVPYNETEQIDAYIADHGVRPYFEV